MQSLLTVTNPASSYNLVSLSMVKSELNINDSSQDDRFKLLIKQTSSAISTICDRIFLKETIQEVFRLNSGRVGRWHSWVREENPLESLILRRRPIASVVDVIEDSITVDSNQYETDLGAGLIYRLTDLDHRTTWLANKITIDYISGYTFDNLPSDLQKACLLWIKSFYASSKRLDVGIKVEDAPDLMRTEYFDPNRFHNYDPPPEVMMLLNPYIESAIR